MNAKTKAKELVEKFGNEIQTKQVGYIGRLDIAKNCALIVCREIIEWEMVNFGLHTNATKYWENVKREIKKIK